MPVHRVPSRSPRAVTAAVLCVSTLILALRVTPSVQAQLPQARITSLSRPGVRSGESVEVTLRGSDLEGASQLWFDHPGSEGRAREGPDLPGVLQPGRSSRAA